MAWFGKLERRVDLVDVVDKLEVIAIHASRNRQKYCGIAGVFLP
jgi:hypothetical protein